MNDCLVTKLVGTVSNDNLLELGEKSFCSVKKGTIGCIPLYSRVDGVVVRAANGGVLCDSSGVPTGQDKVELSINTDYKIYIKAGADKDANVIIKNPSYGVILFKLTTSQDALVANLTGDMTSYFEYMPFANSSLVCSCGINLSDIRVDDSTTFVTIGNITEGVASTQIYGSIEKFYGKPLTSVKITDCGATGDVTLLPLENLDTLSIARTKIGGNIETLGSRINTGVSSLFITSINLTGSVEGFCENMLPRLSGASKTMGVGFQSPNVTLNGIAIGSSAPNYTIEFGANSITVKNRNTSAVLATYDGSTWSYT